MKAVEKLHPIERLLIIKQSRNFSLFATLGSERVLIFCLAERILEGAASRGEKRRADSMIELESPEQ